MSGIVFDRTGLGYGSSVVLEDVSFEVARGEILGLVGPNGAGKSTLLRALTGSADVLSGDVMLSGRSHQGMRATERARLVGVVPQQIEASFSFSAREFVMMGRHVRMSRFAQPSAQDIGVVERALERTDTMRLADTSVDTLSGGDLQRLALAQALAQEPEILLLDEATSHLDLNHRLQVLDLVRRLADDGMVVLAVFHDLDLAARYSDRLAVVHGGGVLAPDAPERVLTGAMLQSVFGVRAVVGTDPITESVTVTPVLRDEDVPAHTRESVFVAAGGGSGARLMGLLAMEGFDVKVGALSRGDMDREVANSLGLDWLDLGAYATPDGAQSQVVRDVASHVDVCVAFAVPHGRSNLVNLVAAVDSQSPLILVGDWMSDLDFAGGEATDAWSRGLARARCVANAADALDAVRSAVASSGV